MKELSYFEETQKDSTLIYDGKVLHVYRDSINLPNGKVGMREYCKHKGAVAVVPLTKDEKVVCIRQYRYALGRVTLEGFVEEVRKPADCGEVYGRLVRGGAFPCVQFDWT